MGVSGDPFLDKQSSHLGLSRLPGVGMGDYNDKQLPLIVAFYEPGIVISTFNPSNNCMRLGT